MNSLMTTTSPHRIIIYGNSGAGKTVMARELEQQLRDDEFSLVRHRGIFDSLQGPKIEYTRLPRVN